jgi:hypothetical protein
VERWDCSLGIDTDVITVNFNHVQAYLPYSCHIGAFANDMIKNKRLQLNLLLPMISDDHDDAQLPVYKLPYCYN